MNFNDLEGLCEAYNQVQELDEGMTMKDFKQQRSRQKQKEKRAAEKTSPTRRAGIHADKASPERAARHRANVDPDFEGNDERNYPGGKLSPKKVHKAKAMGELGEEIVVESEGSYGQTPKARQKMGDLTNKRRNTPASEYSERGEKKKKVDTASKHFDRMGNPDAGNKGKKSSRPYYPGGRKGMTQKDRDWSRGADEYGHSGYDGEGGGGSLPKGKKLERQKKTGVSAESFNTYETILTHLLDEGYASTEEAADKIILNMSEAWFEDIMEARRSEKEGKGSPGYGQRSENKRKGEMGGRHFWSGGQGGSDIERGKKKVKGAKDDENKYRQHDRNDIFQGRKETSGKYSKMQSVRRGSEIGSRFD